MKICLFVCLVLLAQMYSQVFNMQQVKKKRKVPFDLIFYCVVQQCQKTVPLLSIYEIIHFYSMSMLCMIYLPPQEILFSFRYVSSFEVGWLGEMFKWASARAENIEEY